MDKSDENGKSTFAVVIYAVLTWIWFDLNNSYSLPIIGHTELVYGWVVEDANKVKLLFDLIYFSLSVATLIVLTEVIIIQIPLIKFVKDSGLVASITVNFFLLFYQFHVLEFRFQLIGLTIALIIFYLIGIFISEKVLSVLRPAFGIMDIGDSIENINDINNDKK